MSYPKIKPFVAMARAIAAPDAIKTIASMVNALNQDSDRASDRKNLSVAHTPQGCTLRAQTEQTEQTELN